MKYPRLSLTFTEISGNCFRWWLARISARPRLEFFHDSRENSEPCCGIPPRKYSTIWGSHVFLVIELLWLPSAQPCISNPTKSHKPWLDRIFMLVSHWGDSILKDYSTNVCSRGSDFARYITIWEQIEDSKSSILLWFCSLRIHNLGVTILWGCYLQCN